MVKLEAQKYARAYRSPKVGGTVVQRGRSNVHETCVAKGQLETVHTAIARLVRYSTMNC